MDPNKTAPGTPGQPVDRTGQAGQLVNQQPDGLGSSSPRQASQPAQTGGITGNLDSLVTIIGQMNVAIPIVWGAYRFIRELIAQQGRASDALSDEQLIQLMREPADRIVARANEFIAANRQNPDSPL